MQAGRLDRRVTIEAYTATRDAAGGEARNWAELATVWAEKRDLAGREFLTASQEAQAQVETLWRTRWRPDITAKMRLVHDGVIYDIEGVAELGRRDGLELRCRRTNA